MAIGRTNSGTGGTGGVPEFTYTGQCETLNDGGGNWRVKFLTSGTLTVVKLITIDAFLVGGGAGGGKWDAAFSGPGGGSGRTGTYAGKTLQPGTNYSIVIGSGGAGNTSALATAGGATSAFGESISGGDASSSLGHGSNGGSGGAAMSNSGTKAGGSNGSNGENLVFEGNTYYGGSGQASTTKEFADSSGTLYASGGSCTAGSGTPSAKAANTGHGGDGGTVRGGDGGSGIVVIRNARAAA